MSRMQVEDFCYNDNASIIKLQKVRTELRVTKANDTKKMTKNCKGKERKKDREGMILIY